jgi:undecaprenyl diphosphate synthase
MQRQQIPLKVPRHIGIIMDGTADGQKNGSSAPYGAQAGAKAVKQYLLRCIDLRSNTDAVRFSTENWNRPPQEVKTIMDLMGSICST